jgi:hypothetical protein
VDYIPGVLDQDRALVELALPTGAVHIRGNAYSANPAFLASAYFIFDTPAV